MTSGRIEESLHRPLIVTGNRWNLFAPRFNEPPQVHQLSHDVFVADLRGFVFGRMLIVGTFSLVWFLLVESQRPALAFDIAREDHFVAVAIGSAVAFQSHFIPFANPLAELFADVRWEMDQRSVVQLPTVDIIVVVVDELFDRAVKHLNSFLFLNGEALFVKCGANFCSGEPSIRQLNC